MSLSVMKDRAYSRMEGKGAPRPVALSSMALFGTRDAMTIGASFNLPVILTPTFATTFGVTHQTASILAQLSVPLAIQILSTPLHLLGMDIYNSPNNDPQQRREFIKREYTKTLMARWGRIFPAYGIAGVLNKSIRSAGHAYLEASDV